jgi:hypothetical protein
MALRPMGHGKFCLIWECYCHRIVDGPALLGPLPECFQLVRKPEKTYGITYRTYIDRRSGKVRGEDLLLVGQPLPRRWRIETFSEGGAINAFVEG